MKTAAIAIVLACAVVLSGAGLFGADLARFEVATLKQAPPPQGDSISITLGAINGGRLYLTNVTLNDCAKFAYDLVWGDQISGPDWMRSKALLKGGPKMPLGDASQELHNSIGIGHVTGNRATMGLLATSISRMERQIVVDRTGLRGEHQIKLLWAPGSLGADVMPTQDSTAPSIFADVEEQLGLRLEARKGPPDVVEVDQVDKVPAEN